MIPATQRHSIASPTPAPRWALEPGSDPPDPGAVFEAGLRQHHLANTAYPIAHRQTIWHHRQPAARHRALLR